GPRTGLMLLLELPGTQEDDRDKRQQYEAPASLHPLPKSGGAPDLPPLRGATHVGEQAFLDLLDDRQRLAALALPDVAAEDDAAAPGLHHLGGVAEHGLVVGLGAAGEDAQRPARRFDALVDRFLLADLELVVGRRG